jgi:hypothetical protein
MENGFRGWRFRGLKAREFSSSIPLADLPEFCYKAAYYEIGAQMSISSSQMGSISD